MFMQSHNISIILMPFDLIYFFEFWWLTVDSECDYQEKRKKVYLKQIFIFPSTFNSGAKNKNMFEDF